MNVINRKLSLTALVLTLFMASCGDKETDPSSPELNDFEIVSLDGQSDWEYAIIANTDQSYLLVDEVNSKPRTVFFKASPDHPGYPIFLDEEGRPQRAMLENYTFLFSNFKGNTFDIAVIDHQNGIQIVRGVESDFDFDAISKAAYSTEGWREVLKIASIAANVAACGIGIITAPTGIGAALAYVGCGATALYVATELLPGDQEILGLSAQTVGAFATTVGCIQTAGITCALGAFSMAATITDAFIGMAEEQSEIISEANDQLINIPISVGDFAITAGKYDIDEDWTAAVEKELGSNFRPLDWSELKTYHQQGGNVLDLFTDLGLSEYGNSGAILRNGKQKYSSSRGYFASRHEHNKPGSYLAHDNIDSYLISLGSWTGTRKILAIRK